MKNARAGKIAKAADVTALITETEEATSLYLDEFPMKIHHHPVMTTFEVSHA